ncbi:MAG: 50S ribosomal protein L3 N(5)-glutamine methyltransferase [Burkholderiaceae bacterium]|nr:50S ribosomal protein L3 N(5)-glutamine methyltransferase [Burkholderiaceae bacterium]
MSEAAHAQSPDLPSGPAPSTWSPLSGRTIGECVASGALLLRTAGVSFGHGTTNAEDEAAWLVLWRLGLPLDTPLDEGPNSCLNRPVALTDQALLATLFEQRITTRKPAAYLTQEAWLQGVPFYVDERAIVPRSLIAELIADGSVDAFLSEQTHRVLDLCTGNGSLAVLAAMAWPEVAVTGADISADALAVANINVHKHGLEDRIALVLSDGLADVPGPWDLVICNPPYVNAQSMQALPLEYQAEPALALAGGIDGMDFIRQLLRDLPTKLSENGALLLEIGNEREYFEAAFAHLPVFWLDTSAGEDQVLLITQAALRGAAHLR